MDDTGHIVFIGRKGDHMTFKHGGDKIYPKHITDVASSHPNIFESAVSLTNQNVKFTLNQSISFKIFTLNNLTVYMQKYFFKHFIFFIKMYDFEYYNGSCFFCY